MTHKSQCNIEKMSEYEDLKIRSLVINLPARKDRLLLFYKNYKLSVPCKVFPAVYGKDLDMYDLHSKHLITDNVIQSINEAQKGKPKSYHYEVGSINAIGCTLSHYNIWRKMIKEGIDITFVFEDDCLVNKNDKEFAELINNAPPDWHILLLGYHTKIDADHVGGGYFKVKRFFGTHAYIINKKGAEWLMENGKLFPMKQQIDSHMSELASDYGLNVYASNKFFINVNDIIWKKNDSNIQVPNAKDVSFDRMPLD